MSAWKKVSVGAYMPGRRGRRDEGAVEPLLDPFVVAPFVAFGMEDNILYCYAGICRGSR